MQKKKKGASLVLVMAITAIVLILCASLGNVMVFETRQSVRQEKRTQAYYVARGGATAVQNFLEGMTVEQATSFAALTSPITIINNQFDGNNYDVKITRGTDILTVETTGKVKNLSHNDGTFSYVTDTVTMVLTAQSNVANITTALYGVSKLTLPGGGSDASHPLGETIQGDIGIGPGATFYYENAIIKPGSRFFVPSTIASAYLKVFSTLNPVPPGAIITCNPYAPDAFPVLPGDKNYVAVSPPSGLPNKGTLTVGNGIDGNITPVKSGEEYNLVDIKSGNLTINIGAGDTKLVINDLNLGGHIIINDTSPSGTDGRLLLYIRNNISGYNGTINYDYPSTDIVRSKTDSQRLVIYSDKPDFDIKNGICIKGTIFAPNSEFFFAGGATVEGAVVSNIVSGDNGLHIIYKPMKAGGIPVGGPTGIAKYAKDHWQ